VLAEKVNDLFSQQLSEWELAKTNYEQLKSVKTKRIGFGDFHVFVQFNPERIRSSAAKVDTKSVESRPCFLCKANRPVQQKDLIFDETYTILVNPFPIFHKHLTITCNKHIDQRIRNNFSDMLTLSAALPDFVVFYNGPQCGASAPDHLHFQAGEIGFIPLEHDFLKGCLTERIALKDGIEIRLWRRYLRGIISLKGNERKGLLKTFDEFYTKMSEIQPDRPEPMLNILVYANKDGWTIHIIPRKAHRPAQFFNEGNGQILVSPASVDLGGVMITPRKDDFERLNQENVTDIFSQLCFNEMELETLIKGYL
jgi:hypothetical protein